MIVQCRGCSMRYQLDEGILGSKGCHVRCTSCHHVWFQSPPPLPRDTLVPCPENQAPIEQKKQRKFLKLGLLCFVLTMSNVVSFMAGGHFSFVESKWIQAISEIFSGTKQNKLTITAFSAQEEKESKTISCQGTLFNPTELSIDNPILHLILSEKNDDGPVKIKCLEEKLTQTTLAPGQTSNFSLTIPAPFNTLAGISVILP